ncbi:hypothetical protein NP493_5g17012, partial [Ridgeia piscesae]
INIIQIVVCSARILCRKRKCPTDEEEIITAFSKKHKGHQDEEERNTEVTERLQQFQIQNEWVPISRDTAISTCLIVPAREESPSINPHQNNTTPKELLATNGSMFRFRNYLTNPELCRDSPLPTLHWADSQEVWQLMLKKDKMYVRNAQLLARHPGLQMRMRSILLDWLIEEIYPPKLTEFAYVTDGACTEDEILEQELIMLKELNWDLAPITASSWLSIYMQLANVDNMEDTADNFVFPKYSVHEYIQISRLLDLCVLDTDYLQFPYSIVAAAAFYHMSSKEHALATLGLQWSDVAVCIQWMAPFTMVLRELGPVELKFFSQVSAESTHNIQTHVVDLGLLEKVQVRQAQMQLSTARSSPELSTQFPGIITPPQSIKRPIKPHTADEEISDCEAT